MAAPQPPPSGGGNVLTRRLGPLPTWGWVVIAAAIVLGLAWWKARQSNQQAAVADASQVPPFVNQTYTTIQPPVAYAPDDDEHKHRRRHPRHKPDRDDRDKDRGRDRKPIGPWRPVREPEPGRAG